MKIFPNLPRMAGGRQIDDHNFASYTTIQQAFSVFLVFGGDCTLTTTILCFLSAFALLAYDPAQHVQEFWAFFDLAWGLGLYDYVLLTMIECDEYWMGAAASRIFLR
jgi:hypothetical protein